MLVILVWLVLGGLGGAYAQKCFSRDAVNVFSSINGTLLLATAGLVFVLLILTEVGFTIACGVLLDTFIVRSVLVPALVLDAGDRVWWPSRPRQAPTADQGESTRVKNPV